jgi:putative transcriptional regulator
MIRNKLRELRLGRGLTQEKMASELKITRQTIIAVENHRYNPSLEMALKIAKYLNVSIEDIFEIID